MENRVLVMTATEIQSSQDASKWRGRLLIIVGAIMWSTSGFFAKAPIFDEWPEDSRGVLLAFWRALFAAIVLGLMVRRVQWTWKLIPMAATFAAMNWAYLTSLVYCESTLAIWLQYTAPAWVFLIGWLVFRDQPRWRDWLLLAFATVGVSIILSAELWGASPIGVRIGLVSGLTFAGVVLMLRWLRDYDAAWIVFLNHVATALLFLPVVIHEQIYPSGSQVLCRAPSFLLRQQQRVSRCQRLRLGWPVA